MSLNSLLSQDAVKTAIDAVLYQEYEYMETPSLAKATDNMLFKQDTIDRSAVIIDMFQGPGYFEEREELEDAANSSTRIGNQITFAVKNWDMDLVISKNFFDDEQYNVVNESVRKMGANARKTQDRTAVNVYNLGFTTQLVNDGIALFSASHVTMKGSTVSNLISGALTEATLETAVETLQKMLAQDEVIGSFQPQTLFVPTELYSEALRITKSKLRNNTNNNDLNYFSEAYPGLQVKQSPYLTSATAWFLVSREHSITRWVRESLWTSLVDFKISSNRSYIYKAGFREAHGAISYEGAVASTGL